MNTQVASASDRQSGVTESISGNVTESTNRAKESAGAASETTAARMKLDENARMLGRAAVNVRL